MGGARQLCDLTRLHLEQTNVEDRHLETLKGAVHLQYVNLYSTDVGDNGLAHLSSLPELEDVYVWQSQVTDAGVARFLAENADVEVHRGSTE